MAGSEEWEVEPSDHPADGPYDQHTDSEETLVNSLDGITEEKQNEISDGPGEELSDDLDEIPVGPRVAAVLSKNRRRPAPQTKPQETAVADSRQKQPDPLLPQALPLTASVSHAAYLK